MKLPFPLRFGAALALNQVVVTLAVWGLAAPQTNLAASLAIALALNLMLALPLLRSLSVVEAALGQLAEGQAVPLLPARGHGVLGSLINCLNQVLGREQAVSALREQLLAQARDGAAQQERNRLARDLHDSIKQQLFSVSVSAAAAQARWESDPAGAKAALADVRRGAQEAMAEMRALLQQLAPAPLERVGLLEALRDQCEALRYRTGAQVTATLGTLPADEYFPPGAQESLFRIVQEALSNVARHARAQNVQLTLHTLNHQLQLIITDDGQGFTMTTNNPGMGLNNIQQRAAALNGTVVLQSAPAAGTRLEVSIPLNPVATAPVPVYKPDHTFNKVFLTGLVGGLGLILLLWYPLYNLLPQNFVAEWPAATAWSWLALPLEVLAALFAVGVGYGAARWAGVATRQAALSLGALAGLVAGVVFEVGLGNAAWGMVANSAVLQHGMRPAATDAGMIELLVLSVRGFVTWPLVGLWLVLLVGAGLGALGGMVAPLAKPALKPELTVPWRFTLHNVLANVVAGAALATWFAFAIFGLLEKSNLEAVYKYGVAQNVQPPQMWLFGLLFITPVVFYFGALLSLYFMLWAEARLPLATDLQKARLATLPETTSLYAVLALGLPLVVWNIWPANLGEGGQLVLWIATGLGAIVTGLFAHQTWQLTRLAPTTGFPVGRWSWSYNIVGLLVLVGLVPTTITLLGAINFSRWLEGQVWVALTFSAVEAVAVFWLLQVYRQRQQPTHPTAVLRRLVIPNTISSLFGGTLAMALGAVALLMPIHAALGLVVRLIVVLANVNSVNEPVTFVNMAQLIQEHYLLAGQFALGLGLALAVCAGFSALAAWGVAARGKQ